MNNQDYEQKKRECFVQFCKDNEIDKVANISIFDAFDQIFDRAYALGKQEKDAEKSKRMCLRDKSKVCNKCHECDIEADEWYNMSR